MIKNNNVMIYNAINYGNRVAEDEDISLHNYFLATKYWNNLIEGKTDIIIGPKGSGKSALYISLLQSKQFLAENGISIFKAENPRGDTIFSLFNKITLKQEYTSPNLEYLIEDDIVAFWKLYFLNIVVSQLKSEGYNNEKFQRVVDIFEECGLIPTENNLKNIFRHVIHHLKQVVTLQFFQPEVDFDIHTGTIKSVKGKISFKELTPKKIKEGHLNLDDIFSIINESLEINSHKVWIAIDRLDVAFQEDFTLEKRALKTLFNVYNSLKTYSNISLKIFLRNDIWSKLTLDGFLKVDTFIQGFSQYHKK